MNEFNTKGKLCSLIFGEPCPGVNVSEAAVDEVGCPHWRQMVVESSEGTSEVWTGCDVNMMPKLILGVTISVNGAARSVQSTRNVIAGGFCGLAKAQGLNPSEVAKTIRAADSATYNNALVEEELLKGEPDEPDHRSPLGRRLAPPDGENGGRG